MRDEKGKNYLISCVYCKINYKYSGHYNLHKKPPIVSFFVKKIFNESVKREVLFYEIWVHKGIDQETGKGTFAGRAKSRNPGTISGCGGYNGNKAGQQPATGV